MNWNVDWTVSDDSQYVSFVVSAETNGWVAIGFSLDQAMVSLEARVNFT